MTLRGPAPAPAIPSPTPWTPASATPGSAVATAPSGSWPAGWVGGAPTGGAVGDLWRIDTSTDPATAWTIEVGTTPPGWQNVPIFGPPAGPVRLSATGHYTAHVTSLQRPDVTWVSFTLDDLDRLKDGEVWGHKGHSLDERALTLDAYRRQADTAC